MMRFEDVVRTLHCEPVELTLWIERRWVRPDQDIGGFSFDDTDVARARLIQELRHELLIDEEALPVVLSLLDQVYALRRTLRQVAAAMQDLPDTTRDDLIERLRRQHRP